MIQYFKNILSCVSAIFKAVDNNRKKKNDFMHVPFENWTLFLYFFIQSEKYFFIKIENWN